MSLAPLAPFLDFARNDKGGLPDNVFHIILTAQNA